MKRALRTALLILLLSLMGKGYAQDFEDGHLYYTINSDGTSVTVTGYLWEGDLVIPESVTYEGASYAVTAIGDDAFTQYDGYDLGDLVIPNSVVTIGERAFYGACRFTGLTIGNAVTTIGEGAFEYCYDFAGPLVIPNSVVTIGSSAFYGCYGFTALTIGNSVTTIGDYAFGGYSSFEGNLVIPNSVTTLGKGAFSECSGFTGLSIGNSVTTIGDYAFMDCTGFSGNLSIPATVTSIGNGAFFFCRGFTGTLTIPSSVTTIGNEAFFYCCGFSGTLTIPNSVTSIGSVAFAYCNFMGSLVIPSSVTFIDGNAFVGCWSIDHIIVDDENTVYDSRNNCNGIIETASNKLIAGFTITTIPNTVVSIGEYAFEDSNNTSILIPNSVVEIETGAFAYCNALSSIIIPSTVTSIGRLVLAGCNSLEQITVEAGNPVYDSRDDSNAIIESGTNLLISGCKNTVIPNTVTTIGSGAFVDCDNLTSIVIPMSVTAIDHDAFCYSGLTGDLVIPNSVVSIGDHAFYGCYDLNGILTLGNSLTEIGGSAFAECYYLKTVISLASTPPTLQPEALGWEIMDQLVVSCGNKDAYEASEWGICFNSIEEDCDAYSITVEDVTGGVLNTSVNTASMGEEVTISYIAEPGYELNTITVCKIDDETRIVPCYDNSFVMPNFDVVVKPTFGFVAVDENDNVAVSVYPNPTCSNVKVEAENFQHITVLNQLGQQLYDGSVEGDAFEYDFSNRDAGIYLIRIETAHGIATKRVVVTK